MDLDLEYRLIDLPKRVLVRGMAAVAVVLLLSLVAELDPYSCWNRLELKMPLKLTLTPKQSERTSSVKTN